MKSIAYTRFVDMGRRERVVITPIKSAMKPYSVKGTLKLVYLNFDKILKQVPYTRSGNSRP